jgi:DNA-binding PadR family transcriptional regulator
MFKFMFESERQPRLFAKGDIKYVILNILKSGPSHGYEIIQSMEQGFHGVYSPSAGSVYPTLQLLEDLGYVVSSERDGKKVYTITEEGKRFLEESEPIITRIKSHMRDWREESDRDEMRNIFHELSKITRLVSRLSRRSDKKRLEKIADIIAHACRHIEQVIDEEG